MKVRIKSLDGKTVKYQTPWACSFDFRCLNDEVFEPGEFKIIETGLVVEIPEWLVLQISPRSSTYKKHWLIQVNSVWIIDNDYCWDDDTIKFAYYNLSKEKQVLEAGTRIWQWTFLKIEKPNFELVETMGNKNRWGFWSTWIK